MSMKVDLRVGESLRFDNGRIVVTLLEKSGQRARVSVEADDSVAIQVPEKDDMPASRGLSFGSEKMLAGSV
jgi:hypothetical protein